MIGVDGNGRDDGGRREDFSLLIFLLFTLYLSLFLAFSLYFFLLSSFFSKNTLKF